MNRLTVDEYFLTMANLASVRATCDRLWCGCVLVQGKEIVSTGYNGAASGLPECDEVGHLMVIGDDNREHCVRTIHAEQNAIDQAKVKRVNLAGATAYINATPCETCLSELLKRGIKRIICGSLYRSSERGDFTSRLVSAWSAIIEYRPMPDIHLKFGKEVGEVKKVGIIHV